MFIDRRIGCQRLLSTIRESDISEPFSKSHMLFLGDMALISEEHHLVFKDKIPNDLDLRIAGIGHIDTMNFHTDRGCQRMQR